MTGAIRYVSPEFEYADQIPRGLDDRLAKDLNRSETALAGVLNLVTSEMLVPNKAYRSESVKVHEILDDKTIDRAILEPEYLMNRTLLSGTSTQPPLPDRWHRQSLAVPDIPGQPRVASTHLAQLQGATLE
ncbi:hypothetical protein FZEAL_6797 [Fusarium zealandicum]|uniref:Uncharacterized protein n=1 Tax=Fusarium zealandicum TaxID=1053134 RepID=A0A8H4XII2_9HYPO|nr:hypothetical protein FZEAL_6797 [Fusarium zealandicum]